MPGEYFRMLRRLTRDTSFSQAAINSAGTTQLNTKSPDEKSGL